MLKSFIEIRFPRKYPNIGMIVWNIENHIEVIREFLCKFSLNSIPLHNDVAKESMLKENDKTINSIIFTFITYKNIFLNKKSSIKLLT